MMLPWTDRKGRLAPLKLAVFIGTLLPAAWLAYQALTGGLPAVEGSGAALSGLGARPINEAIHQTGDWAIRFIAITLAVTPLRRIANWPRLIMVRRMLGLAALGYALLHLLLYTVDMDWDVPKVASEIVLRIYLTIGFVAVLGLAALGATSTDGAIRRLRQNWNRLHKAIYAIAALGALHFFMQSKIDVSRATLMAGFFVLLFGYRIAHKLGFRLASPVVLAIVAVISGLATAGLEYAWYALATGVPAGRVLAANLDFSYSIRPAWWIVFTGLAVALIPPARSFVDMLRARNSRPAAVHGEPARETSG